MGVALDFPLEPFHIETGAEVCRFATIRLTQCGQEPAQPEVVARIGQCGATCRSDQTEAVDDRADTGPVQLGRQQCAC